MPARRGTLSFFAVFFLVLLAVPVAAFIVLDLVRLMMESQGHHVLYMPGDARRGLFDLVLSFEVTPYMFLMRFRLLLLIVSTLIAFPLLIRKTISSLLKRTALVSYTIILAGICLLLVHYHVGVLR